MLKEFKAFALKGNVLDLAVGVVIGGAFGKIVTSLVNDIIMPVIGLLVGGVNFTDLYIVLSPGAGEAAPLLFNYGTFLQNIFDFLVISFSIFLFVKAVSKLKKKEEPKAEEAPALSKEAELLSEIKELLKEKH